MPPAEPVTTMFPPPPWRLNTFTAALAERNTPVKTTSFTAFQASTLNSSNGIAPNPSGPRRRWRT